MTTVTTTLVSGQNAHVGVVSSRGEYSVTVNSGVQGPAGNTGVSITAANVISGNLVLTFSNSATVDAGAVVGANGANGTNGSNGAAGANGVSITAANVVSGNLVLTFSNTSTLNVGTVVGANGANGTNGSNGTNGVSVTAASVATGNLVITLSNTSTIDAGSVATNAAAPYAWTNTHTFSNSVTFSGSAVVPSSNTLGTALGSATQRWVLIANTGTFSGAVSGITTLAAGNTTITGFANVTSTIQGGSSLTIAGAASGITTLATGNTTITGFANVSTTLQVTGDTTLSANLTVTGNVTGNTAGFAIGYRDVPQNFTNTSLTLALTDAGKHILTQNSGSSTQTITIPPNGTIAFQTGAAITIVVQSTGTVAVANGAGVTMYLAGNSTAKSTVTLNSYSMATLLKIGTNTWMVSGTGAT
jgi:hypothetical protein